MRRGRAGERRRRRGRVEEEEEEGKGKEKQEEEEEGHVFHHPGCLVSVCVLLVVLASIMVPRPSPPTGVQASGPTIAPRAT